MLGSRRGQGFRTVGAWRGDWNSRRSKESKRDGMVGHAKGYRGAAGRHDAGHVRFLRQYQRQRARPEALRKLLRRVVGLRDMGDLGPGGDVYDNRIAGGSPLCLEYTGDSFSVQSVGPQTVDRLGWEGDKTPAFDN